MKFKGTLIGPASGSLAGLTFSHNAGGQYIRQRVIPVNSNTVQQQAIRNFIAQCASAWTTILTQPYRDGWQAYADAVPFIDPLGEPRYVGGLAMFCACNVPRLQAGMTRVDAPPAILTLPTFTLPVYTVTAPSTGSLAFTNTDGWAIAVGGAMLLYTSRGQGVGINYFKGPYRYAGKVLGAVVPPTSPASIPPAFSVVAGQKVFYRVKIVMTDGRASGDAFLVVVSG